MEANSPDTPPFTLSADNLDDLLGQVTHSLSTSSANYRWSLRKAAEAVANVGVVGAKDALEEMQFRFTMKGAPEVLAGPAEIFAEPLSMLIHTPSALRTLLSDPGTGPAIVNAVEPLMQAYLDPLRPEFEAIVAQHQRVMDLAAAPPTDGDEAKKAVLAELEKLQMMWVNRRDNSGFDKSQKRIQSAWKEALRNGPHEKLRSRMFALLSMTQAG